jgi:hypothetical protein
VLENASILIQRAVTKQKDHWQRHYFSIHSLYYAGCAHYEPDEWSEAKMCFEEGLHLEKSLSAFDVSEQFEVERISMIAQLAVIEKMEPDKVLTSKPLGLIIIVVTGI